MDLRDYALGEGSAAERRALEAELAQDGELREELHRWELTLAALRSAPDEEIPRRIAFVSDPVFAPNWWQRLFSAPQWGFASAAVLGGAIVAHGWLLKPSPAVVDQAPVANGVRYSEADLSAAVESAVARAVASVEARQQERLRQVIDESEKRHQTERQMMAASFEENLLLMRKQINRMYVQSANLNVGSVQQ
jgi:anti-sigma factor RsiW